MDTEDKIDAVETKNDILEEQNKEKESISVSPETATEKQENIKLDDIVEKKQIKITLTQFVFICMFVIVMILAAVQNLLYINITGI